MPIEKISIDSFFSLAGSYPVLDVRSPAEYAHAHIPQAHNLPLFSNEERKVVGTAYKREGKQIAVKRGLDFFGTRMLPMVEEAERIWNLNPGGTRKKEHAEKTVLLHCWRGGMRSAGVAWLLDIYGFQVFVLTGGYKTFRNWCLRQFEKPYDLRILGGFTGSGKTAVLQNLLSMGKKVLDLEQLAMHRGSVFGDLGLPPQPSQEMFENKLAIALSLLPEQEPVWVEDESQRIGQVNIPVPLFLHIRSRPVYFLEIPFEGRLENILSAYGGFDQDRLAASILRLQRRLGGLETRNALEFLRTGDTRACFGILLHYYDKFYLKSLQAKTDQLPFLKNIGCASANPVENAERLLRLEEILVS